MELNGDRRRSEKDERKEQFFACLMTKWFFKHSARPAGGESLEK
jgi:hypothetical protein